MSNCERKLESSLARFWKSPMSNMVLETEYYEREFPWICQSVQNETRQIVAVVVK